MQARRSALRVVIVLFLFALATSALIIGGCAGNKTQPPPKPSADTGIALERPDVEGLPEDVRRWVEERRTRRGAYHADFGGEGSAPGGTQGGSQGGAQGGGPGGPASGQAAGKTYILVAWGEKPTGGYSVRIEEVLPGKETDVVLVRLTAPGPGDVVTQALTYPYDLVAIERRGRPITYAYLGELTLSSMPAAPAGKGEEEGKTEGADRGQVSRSKNFEVELPAAGSVITSPVRVKGRARVFEGNFFVELEDGHNMLAKRQVQTAGAPAWGEFDFMLEFDKPTNPAGALIFVTYSAEDGRRQEELLVPVRFQFPR